MDPVLISKIAKLSQLKLTEAEKAEFGVQIASILGHVRSLESVDTREVVERSASLGETPLRDDDRPEDCTVTAASSLVEASEEQIQGLFEVPQVVGSG